MFYRIPAAEIVMFKIKQIGMVASLGLALVLATATVYATTQSAQAFTVSLAGGTPGPIGGLKLIGDTTVLGCGSWNWPCKGH